jgi:DMSO/TMAO reductase YedYZ molybdopterin-dependent catalytic subunit
VTVEDVPADETAQLPNADAAVQPVPGTRAEVTPVPNHYRIDILSSGLPSIPEDYALPITGLVANEVEWTLDDIREMPSQTEFITMSCISNRVGGSLISTTKWTGVSFQHILEQVQPDENATAIRITGADNFDEYIGLDLIRNDERIMLTYAWDDEPLPLRNGFPLRTHIPNRYGMKQPKWITNMEFVDEAGRGYWVRRGWSAEALVKTTSVIDTVSTNSIYSDDSGQMFVPVGGIAHAGDRGIARVEVRVDGGEWQEAELRDPLSDRTWVIWRYDWPFEEGEHTFEVRAYEPAPEGESDPILQPTEPSPARPDGATGIHDRDAVISVPEPAAESTQEA